MGVRKMKGIRKIKKLLNRNGQAAIETGLALPFLIYLLYYTINAFHSIHTAHVGQKFAAMNLYQRLANRSKFSVDSLARDVHGREYMAVQYTDTGGASPRRRILLEPQGPTQIINSVGICKDPAGRCTPE